jgi:hypothetical protein
MRRRLREQRRLREAMLLDLGALVYELHRQGRRAPELLQSKAAELTVVDDKVRELQAALEGGDTPEASAETAEVDAVIEEAPEEESLAEDADDEEGDPAPEPALADHEDSRG